MAAEKSTSTIAGGVLLMFFTSAWLAVCAAGSWFIYTEIAARSSDAAVSVSALQAMAWPFATVTIAGPLILLLGFGGLRIVAELRQFQKLADELPGTLDKMTETSARFEETRDRMTKLVNRWNEAAPADEVRTIGEESGTENAKPELVDQFMALYEDAKTIFYQALERYNAKHPSEALYVSQGGGNFEQLAHQLRNLKAYSSSGSENERVGQWVVKVFVVEKSTRRGGRKGLSPEEVAGLSNDKPTV